VYRGIADREKQRLCSMTDHSPHDISGYRRVERLDPLLY